MDSDKDQKVKRIARFLELGGTMLAEHCKVCGAPKFRYQGMVICPICDVREEGEESPAPEPAAEVQVPEARSSIERDRSSFESRKKLQARRQKPRLGQRMPETEDEEEKNLQPVDEEVPEISYETDSMERTTSEVQAVPSVRAESTQASTGSMVDKECKELEGLLFKKMVSIAASLQNEKNPRSIAENLELIEKSVGLIERLRKI